jgi:hypothetical protein
MNHLDIASINSSVNNFTWKESCEVIARGGIRMEVYSISINCVITERHKISKQATNLVGV